MYLDGSMKYVKSQAKNQKQTGKGGLSYGRFGEVNASVDWFSPDNAYERLRKKRFLKANEGAGHNPGHPACARPTNPRSWVAASVLVTPSGLNFLVL